jgi:hypothetical protein
MKWFVAVVGSTLAAVASLPASAGLSSSSRRVESAGAYGIIPLQQKLDPHRFASVADGAVLIRTFSCNGTAKFSGSGFLVGERVVMTARHVVDEIGAERGQCHAKVFASGKWIRVVGVTTWRMSRHSNGRVEDLATLKLAAPATGYIFNFRHARVRVGSKLAAIGHPLGKAVSLTQGTMIGKLRIAGVPYMVVNVLGAEGASGSPFVDKNGDVAGVLQQGLGSKDIAGQRTSGIVTGIDLTAAWPHARKQLCRAYPNGGIPDCEGTTPPPPPPPPSPDFHFTFAPPSASVQSGGTADFVVSVIPSGGFNNSINFTVSALPPSISATWGTATPSGVPFQLHTTTATPAGSYFFGVTGTSGALTRTVYGTLSVTGGPAVAVNDAWLSADQDGQNRITSFPSGEVTVYLQLTFQTTTQPHTFQTKWIDPAGQIRLTTSEFTLNFLSGRAYQGAIFHTGSTPGTWHGQWFIDGVLAKDVPFNVQ